MYQPLPEFPPLFPSMEWWRVYLRSLAVESLESGRRQALAQANRGCGVRARDWMRVRLAGDAVLPVPVEGGASALKNRLPSSWRIAGVAPREIRTFRATLATLYGRTPFYHLLESDLTGFLAECGPGTPASDICDEAFRKVSAVLSLGDDILVRAITQKIGAGDTRLREIVSFMSPASSPELSILDPLFRLGPDAIFTLLPAF